MSSLSYAMRFACDTVCVCACVYVYVWLGGALNTAFPALSHCVCDTVRVCVCARARMFAYVCVCVCMCVCVCVRGCALMSLVTEVYYECCDSASRDH